MARVGKNIKILRTAQNMTQDDLAGLLFVSRQTVSNYETGKSNPDIDTLVRIAEALKTDPNSLIYGLPQPKDRKKDLIWLCAQAAALAALAAAVLFLTPVADKILKHEFDVLPGLAIVFCMKPCLFFLLGWTVMHAVFLAFRIEPPRRRWVNWVHGILLGLLAVYLILMAPHYIAWIVSYAGPGASLGWSFGPVWNKLSFWLLVKSAPYLSVAFLLLGLALCATKPRRRASKQASGEETER